MKKLILQTETFLKNMRWRVFWFEKKGDTEDDENQTELSNLIWTLTDNGTSYKLSWNIIDRARPYQPGKRTCNLCLSEKYHILVGSHLINRKTELLNKCPHRRKFSVAKPQDITILDITNSCQLDTTISCQLDINLLHCLLTYSVCACVFKLEILFD